MSAPIAQQPMATQGMVVNPRNALNKPNVDGKGREWSNGICGFSDACGTCCVAWFCPCIIYGSNKQRLEHLERNGTPDPDQGGMFNSDCMLYGALAACLGVGCILQVGTRGAVRGRYGIQGGGCGDFFTSCCCTPCALTQEEQEISLEEKAISQGQGLYQKA
ncbi:hypothetical protein C0991_009000 [Blastosporella zonata]|nr:hypothetical protein C0991_009000 [Blastosporella zonata]